MSFLLKNKNVCYSCIGFYFGDLDAVFNDFCAARFIVSCLRYIFEDLGAFFRTKFFSYNTNSFSLFNKYGTISYRNVNNFWGITQFVRSTNINSKCNWKFFVFLRVLYICFSTTVWVVFFTSFNFLSVLFRDVHLDCAFCNTITYNQTDNCIFVFDWNKFC